MNYLVQLRRRFEQRWIDSSEDIEVRVFIIVGSEIVLYDWIRLVSAVGQRVVDAERRYLCTDKILPQ